MKSTLAILLVITGALVVAQQDNGLNNGDNGVMPGSYRPTGSSPAAEQLAVEQQNQALGRAFAQAFPEATPEEFHLMIVALYIRCQAELDNCSELLWESHLLREYRKCALTQRRFCAQDIQELQAQLEAITAQQFVLSPEEEEILSQLDH